MAIVTLSTRAHGSKRLERVKSFYLAFPGNLLPPYDLNYFVISYDGKDTVIEYHRIDKTPSTKLTLLQRFLISLRKKPPPSKSLQ
jgi:hypothetical protein